MAMRIKAFVTSVIEMDVDTDDINEAYGEVEAAIKNDCTDYFCRSVDVDSIECIATTPRAPIMDICDAMRDDAMDASFGWDGEIV